MDSAGLANEVDTFLKRYVTPDSHVTVGLSGGVDSVVLLHLVHSLLGSHVFKLVAHHINHQISPNADSWEAFCSKLCDRLQIPFTVTRVQVDRSSGKGLEASARSARHEAFSKLVTDFILLAHHQDDQAETLLFRLLRGTGVKGMTGIKECAPLPRSATTVLRPLLHIPRSVIHQYAKEKALDWVNDESNQNSYYSRNFLRREILPLLETRFPSYRMTLEKAAQHFAESANLLNELAELDGKSAIEKNRLSIERLRRLSGPRAKNLLRFFLSQNNLKMPDHRLLDEWIKQLWHADSESKIRWLHDSIELRTFKYHLYILKLLPLLDDLSLRWNKKDYQWSIPELGGTLIFKEVIGKGIALTTIVDEQISIRVRKGGERICLEKKRPSQKLKNILQEIAMPPWERERLPLIYVNERLACIPNIGCDVDFACMPDAKGLVIEWIPSMFNW